MLRRWCRLIVQWFGPSWGRVGWILFLFRLWVPNLFVRSPYYDAVTWLLDGFLFAWWLIDATKQCVNRTVVKLGVLLCLSCFIPHNNLPIILLWLFYWVYVRD
jgi:hypothetical protein